MKTVKTVLIIEDEDILRDVYTMVLKKSGFNVVGAVNGVDGLNQMKRSQPDLVLLDVMMPVMDGLEFMRNLELADYPNAKVIVYSNMSDRAIEDEMSSLGAYRFVLKSSMTPKDLVALLSTA